MGLRNKRPALLISPNPFDGCNEAFDLPFRPTYSPFLAFLYHLQDPPVADRQRGRQEEQAIVDKTQASSYARWADGQILLAIATATGIYHPAWRTNNGHCARGFCFLSQASKSLF